VRLPFEKRRTDFASWSYDHRVGIFVTIVAYLVFGIVFITARIGLGSRDQLRSIIIETPEQKELTPQERQILTRMLQEDFSDVRNLSSNENAEADSRTSNGSAGQELNPALRDDRGTQASELYEDAGKVEDAMRANREAYEAGLAQERAMDRRDPGRESSSQTQRQDAKVQGRVTVSFSFADPLRTSVSLTPPAYMCAGGGVVELAVTLDNNGYVTSATVNKNVSSGDECMQDAALGVARRSRFNVDPAAPSAHKGTITYTFIPQ
jgi:TonB family protein